MAKTKKKKYNSVNDALLDGYNLHGFRSGGGLRVLSLERRKGEQTFYGESVDFYEALRVLGDDVKAGGRKYKDVYGKIESHYLTGRYPDAGDAVDTWLYQGHGFDVVSEDGVIVVQLVKKHLHRTPKAISQYVGDSGKVVKWKFKDFPAIFTSKLSKEMVGAVTTSAEGDAKDPWFHELKFEGRAHDLSVALVNAFAKTEVEPTYEFISVKNK